MSVSKNPITFPFLKFFIIVYPSLYLDAVIFSFFPLSSPLYFLLCFPLFIHLLYIPLPPLFLLFSMSRPYILPAEMGRPPHGYQPALASQVAAGLGTSSPMEAR